MYKVFCDGRLMHDPAAGYNDLVLLNPVLTQQANCADSFKFTMLPNHRNAGIINRMSSVIEVYDDDELLSRCRPYDNQKDFLGRVTWQCEGDLAFFNDTIVRPYTFRGSVEDYVLYLIGIHNAQVPSGKQFTVGRVTVTDPNDYIVRSSSGYPTTMREIQDKLIGLLGGYIVIRRENSINYLDYLEEITAPSTQAIRLTKNLLNYKYSAVSKDLATALLPLGAVLEDDSRVTIASVNDGLDFIQDDDAVAAFGFILRTETWNDVTVPANLLTKAQKRLADLVGEYQIELTAIDLHLTDTSIDPFRILHNVSVIDPVHGSGSYLILKKTTDLSKPANNKITVGTNVRGLSADVKNAEAMAEEAEDSAYQRATNAIDKATEQITGFNGGYVMLKRNNASGKPEELLIMDTDSIETAVNVWRFNVNGWGHSSTGYNGQFTMAATIDGGIVADFITTGILNANLIRTGKIVSDDGVSFVLDIDNSTLSVSRYNDFMDLYQRHYAIDDAGDLVISASNSDRSIRFSNERIGFWESGAEVAYISGHILYITDVRVLGGLEIVSPDGLHYTRFYTDNAGTFCLQFMGDEE